MDLSHALDIAMGREKGANDFYSKAAEITQDPQGKEAFVWLAHQEMTHFNSLRKLQKSLRELSVTVSLDHLSSEDDRILESLPLSEASGEVTATTKAVEALQGAVENEKTSIELYRRLERSTTDPGAKAMFNGLVSEEQTHLLILEAQLKAFEQCHSFLSVDKLLLEVPD